MTLGLKHELTKLLIERHYSVHFIRARSLLAGLQIEFKSVCVYYNIDTRR